ncbi:hypothetical protein NKG94_35385 [Micromonospora sp. M12]
MTAQLSVSVDGFYAGPRFDGDGDWMDSAESAGSSGSPAGRPRRRPGANDRDSPAGNRTPTPR